MARVGDCRRFLLVAEPEVARGVYGVGYEIPETVIQRMSFENVLAFHEMLREAARVELFRRIEAGEKQGEGRMWSDFESGYTVTYDENNNAVKIEMTPHLVNIRFEVSNG